MKRPLGITLLALLLSWLALGAFALTMTAETLAPLGVRWQLVRIGALVYGLAAAVAAVGLWRLRRWSYVAFVAWVAAVLAVGWWAPAIYPQPTVPWWGTLLWTGFVGVIMLPLARYVRRVVALSSQGHG
jgi:hypothetical protein